MNPFSNSNQSAQRNDANRERIERHDEQERDEEFVGHGAPFTGLPNHVNPGKVR